MTIHGAPRESSPSGFVSLPDGCDAVSRLIQTKSKWLVSTRFDLGFFIAPGFISILILLLSPSHLLQAENLPVWSWILFVIMIDVAHVYASLYRTYFDGNEFRRRKTLYLSVPASAFLLGVVLYTWEPLYFWRALAYAAVIHFVRQQYGFMALYKYRMDERSRFERMIDKWLLYLSTFYPLAYWHTHLPRKFVWFVEGDFLSVSALRLSRGVGVIYLALVVLYVFKEMLRVLRGHPLNPGKNLVLLTTALTWYVGIVYYNSDYSFTVTNVVSHGVPYFGLVWIYCRREWGSPRRNSWLHPISQPKWIGAFMGILIFLAFFEEWIWDVFVWREHSTVFGVWNRFVSLEASAGLSLLVPLLAVPQATHYVLDAFIWKLNSNNPDLQRYLFQPGPDEFLRIH
ncbi:MAG: hypothetical protein DMG06_00135 [Acidobacteria bacterium]|nr:MAG: hypothetical protein DMG06_00135 [Acidobacteriota bacterium]